MVSESEELRDALREVLDVLEEARIRLSRDHGDLGNDHWDERLEPAIAKLRVNKKKTCSTCKEQKDLTPENFRLDKRHKDGYGSQCQLCIRKHDRDHKRRERAK